MNYGQQIKWLDGQNNIHMGTVVAKGNEQGTIWGVTHILNPKQGVTQPETFVSNQGGNWRIANTSTGQAQFAYTNGAMQHNGKYAPQAVPNAPSVPLGAVVYQEQYKKQRAVNGR